MNYLTTEALLLRTYPYQESSAIVDLLSPLYGRIRGVAKGVYKRTTKQKTNQLSDILGCVHVIFSFPLSGELCSIIEITPIHVLPTTPSSLEVNACVCLAAEWIYKSIPLQHPDPALYSTIKKYSLLVRQKPHPLQWTLFLGIKLLHSHGTSPLHAPVPLSFRPQGIASLINVIISKEWLFLMNVKISGKQSHMLWSLIQWIMHHLLDIRLKSADFFQEVCLTQ